MAVGGALADSIALCETSTTTIEQCLSALEADLGGDWPRLEALFHHQIDCWREIAADLGWQTFSDFVDFPWQNSYSAVTMPGTRQYEHFFDLAGCNQVWNMGRGRTQPDAITFYDVPAHEHNVILSTDRTSITPWVTHDERVLQFFGVTDSCVELYVDDATAGSGQGLAPNQWRIEYFNATGHVYINSTDLGKGEDQTLGYSDAAAANYPLEEASLYICRTPFYLQVCNAAAGPLEGIGGCDQGCEYFPAFTATDADLGPFTKHGIYDAACEAGDILSFNGLRAALDTGDERAAVMPDLSLDTTPVATPEIWFADGCQSENYLVLDGQEIHLYENFFGVMEVVIPDDVCADATLAAEVDAITFHKVADDSILTSYTYDDLCTNP